MSTPSQESVARSEPLPFIPSWKNLKIFGLGAIWCVIGASGAAIYEIWDSQNYEHTDWRHIQIVCAIGSSKAALAYWRKHKALITPPPE